MSRLARTALLAVAALLLATGPALAAGGGGSSSFGGGGGGGGGFSGGGGYSGGGGTSTGSPFLVLAVVLVVLVVFAVSLIRALMLRKRRRERHARVVTAAAEAGEDDAAFAADAVQERGRALFEAVQLAWDRRDRAALRRLVGPELMQEWTRRLDDFDRKGWHNRVKLTGTPEVLYVGLVNREDDADDRVVLWVACQAQDYVETRQGQMLFHDGEKSADSPIAEYWTLAKHEGDWRVESIETPEEGAHHLDGEIIATPWGDEGRLHDAAVAERAAAEALPAGMSPAEVADLDFAGPARTAAQDLALADGRFDPALVEASVRRAVDAWVTAVDGDDAPLEAVATPEAVLALLHPGDRSRSTRLVVRGPRLEAIRIAQLDAAATPPALVVEVRARGRRYVEDRDTAAVVRGSRERETTFTETWTLTLDGAGEWPWRVAGVGAPVRS